MWAQSIAIKGAYYHLCKHCYCLSKLYRCQYVSVSVASGDVVDSNRPHGNLFIRFVSSRILPNPNRWCPQSRRRLVATRQFCRIIVLSPQWSSITVESNQGLRIPEFCYWCRWSNWCFVGEWLLPPSAVPIQPTSRNLVTTHLKEESIYLSLRLTAGLRM